MTRILMMLALCVAASIPARADAPKVVADIAPVHSLVAQVMKGVGEPGLLLSAASSPHGYAMRPSQAKMLSQADIVFWIGDALTPWLGKALEGRAGRANSIALLEHPDTLTREAREEAVFKDDHDDHDHDHHHHGYDGDVDPHAWLDPKNAAIWVRVIEKALAEADAQNAELYRANAEAIERELTDLTDDIAGMLAPVRSVPFIAYHDAYQYFEQRFELTAAASIARNDAATPGPARVRSVGKALAQQNVQCLFSEPQTSVKTPELLARGSAVQIVSIDPLGRDFTPGPTLYAQTLRAISKAMVGCLGR